MYIVGHTKFFWVILWLFVNILVCFIRNDLCWISASQLACQRFVVVFIFRLCCLQSILTCNNFFPHFIMMLGWLGIYLRFLYTLMSLLYASNNYRLFPRKYRIRAISCIQDHMGQGMWPARMLRYVWMFEYARILRISPAARIPWSMTRGDYSDQDQNYKPGSAADCRDREEAEIWHASK